MNAIVKAKPRVRVPSRTVAAWSASGPSAAYMRGNSGPVFAGWKPALREARDEIRVAWKDAAARAIDLIHNSGFVSGIVDQSSANVVGSGLKLNLKPDAATLGWTESEADDWARRVEKRFLLWASNPYECDAAGRRSLFAMQDANHKQFLTFGETLALVPFKKRPGNLFGTKLKCLPAYHLSSNTVPGKYYQGVARDDLDMPIAYLIRQRSPSGGIVDMHYAARDDVGCAQVLHVHDAPTGGLRGISRFAPVLRVTKQFDQLADATLTSAIVRAVFAATIESTEPTEEMLRALQTPAEMSRAQSDRSLMDQWFEARSGWYDETNIDLGITGRFAHLYPGQKLSFHDSSAPAPDYEKFASFLLREVARCAGMTFESATGDYRQATYSSIRMATSDIFPLTLQVRRNVHSPFSQGAFEAWLEEDINSGATPFPDGLPGFLNKKAAACNAEWRGGPKPQADDKKTAEAHKIWKDIGVITDEMICADLGTDVEDVYAQRAREKAMREGYGLPEYSPAGVTGIGTTAAKDKTTDG